MGLGGGIFNVQNKVLPGSYMNFVSAGITDAAVSERGVVAAAGALQWGKSGMTVLTKADFQKNSAKYFGFHAAHGSLWYIREMFRYSSKVILYNLNSSAAYASNTYGRARYHGVGGNMIKTEIIENYDNSYSVTTFFGSEAMDIQNVTAMTQLKDNDYVIFDKTAVIAETAIGGLAMTGGATTTTAAGYLNFLNELENYRFNVLVCDVVTSIDPTDADSLTRRMFEEYTKRRRDSEGVKFQTVIYDYPADYEGIISVKNTCDDFGKDETALVFWVGGVCAGLTAGQSALNMKYDGELDKDDIENNFNSSELENCIEQGYFTLHKVNDELRVLADINSLVSVSDTKGSIFKENQTVRVCDQIANDIALLFAKKYMGRVPNDKAGRLSLWNDIVKFHEQLEQMRAIEDFEDDSIVVDIGETKTSVVVYESINVINAMAKLYMTVTVM